MTTPAISVRDAVTGEVTRPEARTIVAPVERGTGDRGSILWVLTNPGNPLGSPRSVATVVGIVGGALVGHYAAKNAKAGALAGGLLGLLTMQPYTMLGSLVMEAMYGTARGAAAAAHAVRSQS